MPWWPQRVFPFATLPVAIFALHTGAFGQLSGYPFCPFPCPYITRVPIKWWPHRVLCALWTRCPIVKVAMGCCTEPAIVHIARVFQKWHFFSSFNFSKSFIITHQKNTRTDGFFFHLSDFFYALQKEITHLYRHTHLYPPKKLHALTILLYMSYIFHGAVEGEASQVAKEGVGGEGGGKGGGVALR